MRAEHVFSYSNTENGKYVRLNMLTLDDKHSQHLHVLYHIAHIKLNVLFQ